MGTGLDMMTLVRQSARGHTASQIELYVTKHEDSMEFTVCEKSRQLRVFYCCLHPITHRMPKSQVT